MNNALPIGWEDRHNTMSEKDIALGGAAATKFASRSVYQDGDVAYKSSDDVRAHYRKQMEIAQEASPTTTKNNNVLPSGWGEREKEKDIIAKQSGVFAADRKGESPLPTNCSRSGPEPSQGTPTSSSAEVALLQVTTHSLEALASVMESSKNGSNIPNEERAKFATAIKRAMNALANCR
eukprot:scaffold1046_cov172-Amphora_coffeaeformis.AAC.12